MPQSVEKIARFPGGEKHVKKNVTSLAVTVFARCRFQDLHHNALLRKYARSLAWKSCIHHLYQVREKQPKHKVFGRDIPGTSGTQTSGYPGQKLYAGGLFLLF